MRHHPTNHQALRHERELKQRQKAEAKRQQRKDPRRIVHASAFPEAPEEYQGIARTLSTGLDR